MFLPGTVGAVVGSHCDVAEELPLGLLTPRLCGEQLYVKSRLVAPDKTSKRLFSLYVVCAHKGHTRLHFSIYYAAFN